MGDSAQRIYVNKNTEILYQGTESAVSQADYDVSDPNYAYFKLDITQWAPSVDSNSCAMRTSADGTTFDTGGSDYHYFTDANAVTAGFATVNFLRSWMSLDGYASGNAANEEQNFSILIFRPYISQYTKVFALTYGKNSSSQQFAALSAGLRLSAARVQAVRIFPLGGGTVTYKYQLTGVKL